MYSFTEASTTISVSVVRNKNTCPECGSTKKSGILSCCARGGAWFKKCGDADDTMFDHTWAEGIQACIDLGNLPSVESSQRVMLQNLGVDVYPVNTTKPQNVVLERTNNNCRSNGSNTSNMDSEKCVELAKFVLCICIFYIISNLQIQF